MEPLRGGHNRNKFLCQGSKCSLLLMHFEPLRSRQPLYKERNEWVNVSTFRGFTVFYLIAHVDI